MTKIILVPVLRDTKTRAIIDKTLQKYKNLLNFTKYHEKKKLVVVIFLSFVNIFAFLILFSFFSFVEL